MQEDPRENPPTKEKATGWQLAQGISIGIALGTVFGVLTENIGVGIAGGVGLGTAIGIFLQQRKR